MDSHSKELTNLASIVAIISAIFGWIKRKTLRYHFEQFKNETTKNFDGINKRLDDLMLAIIAQKKGE